MTGNVQRGRDIGAEAVLGRYRVHERIARGGMGEVWLATQHGPGGFRKKVVIKTVVPELAARPDHVEMLIHEASLAARLHHPNIVQVYDLDCVDDIYFMAMEYVPGRTLAQALQRHLRRGACPPTWLILAVAAACADGLQYAHDFVDDAGRRLEVLHRDVSPSNVMLSFAGNVTILDFGIAVSGADTERSRTGALKGKYHYMAPERVRGELADRRSDVYSLGVVLYQGLTGSRPYRASADFELLQQIVAGPPEPPSRRAAWIPAELDRIVMRAMAHDPAVRYAQAAHLAADLRGFLRRAGEVPDPGEIAAFMRATFPEAVEVTGDGDGEGMTALARELRAAHAESHAEPPSLSADDLEVVDIEIIDERVVAASRVAATAAAVPSSLVPGRAAAPAAHPTIAPASVVPAAAAAAVARAIPPTNAPPVNGEAAAAPGHPMPTRAAIPNAPGRVRSAGVVSRPPGAMTGESADRGGVAGGTPAGTATPRPSGGTPAGTTSPLIRPQGATPAGPTPGLARPPDSTAPGHRKPAAGSQPPASTVPPVSAQPMARTASGSLPPTSKSLTWPPPQPDPMPAATPAGTASRLLTTLPPVTPPQTADSPVIAHGGRPTPQVVVAANATMAPTPLVTGDGADGSGDAAPVRVPLGSNKLRLSDLINSAPAPPADEAAPEDPLDVVDSSPAIALAMPDAEAAMPTRAPSVLYDVPVRLPRARTVADAFTAFTAVDRPTRSAVDVFDGVRRAGPLPAPEPKDETAASPWPWASSRRARAKTAPPTRRKRDGGTED